MLGGPEVAFCGPAVVFCGPDVVLYGAEVVFCVPEVVLCGPEVVFGGVSGATRSLLSTPLSARRGAPWETMRAHIQTRDTNVGEKSLSRWSPGGVLADCAPQCYTAMSSTLQYLQHSNPFS